jgi:hypothetical protein
MQKRVTQFQIVENMQVVVELTLTDQEQLLLVEVTEVVDLLVKDQLEQLIPVVELVVELVMNQVLMVVQA